MSGRRDIVITGLGVVSPIGIGSGPFWGALAAGTSGVRLIDLFDASSLRVRFGGQVPDFDPRLYVRPRKSLKVMSREIQMGFAAADLAMTDAGMAAGGFAPERCGVVFGGDMIYADPRNWIRPTAARSPTAGSRSRSGRRRSMRSCTRSGCSSISPT